MLSPPRDTIAARQSPRRARVAGSAVLILAFQMPGVAFQAPSRISFLLALLTASEAASSLVGVSRVCDAGVL